MKISAAAIESYIERIATQKLAACLVFGPERGLINFRFNAIAKKIVPDISDPFLVVNLTKERFAEDPSCLADEFYSISMLGGRKLILIRDNDAAITASLKSLFADKNIDKSDNFILIEAGDLDKSSAIRKLAEDNAAIAAIACYEDNDLVIKKYIESEIKKHEIKTDKDCLEFLFENFSKDRQIIALEISRIATFLNGRQLTLDLLNDLVNNQSVLAVDEFINNFIAKRTADALLTSQKLLKNDFEAITLIRFLSNYLQKLYHAKAELEQGASDFETIIKKQRLFFKTEFEFRKQLKNINRVELEYWLKNLEELEIKIKTSSNISPKLLFSVFTKESLS